MVKPRLLMSWSSGKDSAWALHCLRRQDEFDVVGLVTTVNGVHDRVAMHGVRRDLVEAQAEAVGLPLWVVDLPDPCTNDEYARRMRLLIERAVEGGVTHMGFGDLFLDDIRAYRERQLAGTGITPVFPLWGADTGSLAKEMLEGGLRAVVSCVDSRRVSKAFAGCHYDETLLEALPPGVDRCAENGEFHTFCFAGPMFGHEIEIVSGEVVEHDGFVYSDLLPAG